MKMRLIWTSLCLAFLAAPVWAQDATLADVRRDLERLNADITALKAELAPGGVSGASASGSVLDRVAAIEAEIQRLTGRTEELEFRLRRVIEDGTNRIGDLEFRLVELEGGDVSQLGETSTLGGGSAEPSSPVASQPVSDTQLAVGEQGDFEAAQEALDTGDYTQAATRFAAFREAYPGSPFEAEALIGLGRALDAQGDTRSAARAYLDSYSSYPQSPFAAEALFRVGEALGRLGKVQEACVTLTEVGLLFEGDPFAAQAAQARASLGCS
ncbi:tetratricopeptide repeat protein [Pseudaestuariivita sp.]|uniref:tetratricopeptide repeat protein n=1 Tax=Pseudaestuariivita sp. TaxID=2211669 RepID=UPI004058588B